MAEQEEALKEFDHLISKAIDSNKIEKIEEDIWASSFQSKVKMAFIASTHGNEPIGVKVFSNFLKEVIESRFVSSHSFVLILGNREAYKKNTRFIEEDLNRQYHLGSQSKEGQRAKIISQVLDSCDICLDIHQTVHQTKCPFWIFPFSKEKAFLASYLAKELSAVITDFKGLVSTTSSYMASKNKMGLTLELSDFGFSKEALKLGVEIIQNCLLKSSFLDGSVPKLFKLTFHKKFLGGSRVQWKKGLQNFQFVEKGDLLGDVDGLEFCAEVSGTILLYPSVMFQQKPQPEGLYMICLEQNKR